MYAAMLQWGLLYTAFNKGFLPSVLSSWEPQQTHTLHSRLTGLTLGGSGVSNLYPHGQGIAVQVLFLEAKIDSQITLNSLVQASDCGNTSLCDADVCIIFIYLFFWVALHKEVMDSEQKILNCNMFCVLWKEGRNVKVAIFFNMNYLPPCQWVCSTVCVLKIGASWLWPEDLSPMPVGKSTMASGKKARQSWFSVFSVCKDVICVNVPEGRQADTCPSSSWHKDCNKVPSRDHYE